LSEANAHRDDLTTGRATNNLGTVANLRGRHEAALALYRLAVPAYQRAGHTTGLGETHHNIAITLRDLHRYDEADRHERRAIEYAREAGNLRLQAMARAGRAELCLLRGEPVLAIAGARLAAEDYGTVPDPVGEADALRLIGVAQTTLGEAGPARQALGRALQLAERHGSSLIRAEALRARAALFRSLGNVRDAETDVRKALEIFDQLGAQVERQALEAWWAASD
jgi:tetratricopeptide (TPR) repeat protein